VKVTSQVLPPKYFGKESQAPDDAPQSRQFQLASDMPRPPDTAFICTSSLVISFLFSLHENESLPIHSAYHLKLWEMEGKWKRRVMPFRQLTPGRSECCECSGNLYIGGTFIHEDIESAIVEAYTKDMLFIPVCTCLGWVITQSRGRGVWLWVCMHAFHTLPLCL
jgi:hypothetical protein